MTLFLGLDTSNYIKFWEITKEMSLSKKGFSKYLIVFEVFAMFWFSDLEKNEAKLIFFEFFCFEPRHN